jgi:hypothetical protein
MAAFNFVDSFVTQLAAGSHVNAINASTNTLKVYLTNATPSASADSLKADLAEIANGNGYTAGGIDTVNTTSQTGGTITVGCTDTLTITASGGSIADFRYVVLFNEDTTGDMLIGWWDSGATQTITDGNSFEIDFTTDVLFTVG